MTARTQALDMLRGVARKDEGGRIVHQFAVDPGRIDRMGVEAAGLYLDLSKQAWTAEAFNACLALAEASGLHARKLALFNGEAVNGTEGRAVLHPALRAPTGAHFEALGEPVSAEVEAVRADMKAYVEAGGRNVSDGEMAMIRRRAADAGVIIGIDGGGSKTLVAAARPDGEVVELRRGAITMSITWPSSAAADFAAGCRL